MPIDRKLPAFTLFELTVAMLLSAIVTALIYVSYSYVGKSYLEFDQRNRAVSELLLTDQLITGDVNKARLIRKTNSGLEFSNAEGITTYTFQKRGLVRDQQSLRNDTMPVSDRAFQCFFRGSEAGPLGIIDQLVVPVASGDEHFSFSFLKHYSAEELMDLPLPAN